VILKHGDNMDSDYISYKAVIEIHNSGESMKVDLYAAYKILLALKESPSKSLNVSEIVKATGLSPNTVEKYIEILKARQLIEEKRNKERKIIITQKGEDYVFLFSRLLAIFGS